MYDSKAKLKYADCASFLVVLGFPINCFGFGFGCSPAWFSIAVTKHFASPLHFMLKAGLLMSLSTADVDHVLLQPVVLKACLYAAPFVGSTAYRDSKKQAPTVFAAKALGTQQPPQPRVA